MMVMKNASSTTVWTRQVSVRRWHERLQLLFLNLPGQLLLGCSHALLLPCITRRGGGRIHRRFGVCARAKKHRDGIGRQPYSEECAGEHQSPPALLLSFPGELMLTSAALAPGSSVVVIVLVLLHVLDVQPCACELGFVVRKSDCESFSFLARDLRAVVKGGMFSLLDLDSSIAAVLLLLLLLLLQFQLFLCELLRASRWFLACLHSMYSSAYLHP